jgi:biotin operon repressor
MLDAGSEIENAVMRARALAWSGDDEAAKAAFVEALRLDATHFEALSARSLPEFRAGSKSAQLLKLLGSRNGVTTSQLAERLDWTEHSVRAALCNLTKKGFQIDNIGERGNATYQLVA